MNAIQAAWVRLLRGPHVSGILKSIGIDPRRFWLLNDLFDLLSERGEMLDQLGRNGVALKFVTWMYAAFFALLGILLVARRPAMETYFSTFLAFTAFVLLAVLLSETGNSLVNPVEGLVLAHQPVNGATYTAAKLTHLARIILYLVLGLNAVPALAGLALKGARWTYPLIHLLSVLAVGSLAGLLCCALYGWLIRLLTPGRLKAAGQLAGAIPFLAMIWWVHIRDFLARFHVREWLPAEPAARTALALALGVMGIAVAVLGIRSLSADYLIRVSGILHGGSAQVRSASRSWIGATEARLFGGQPGRAGYEFVSRMTRRDYQFRRQTVQTLVFVLPALLSLVSSGWQTDPFSGRFTTAHLLPHIFGFLLIFVSSILPYGNDFKGAWIFSLAPSHAFGRFARGIHAALWIQFLALPHLILLLVFSWPWGLWHAALFTTFSLAASSVYLALALRLIDALPFSSQLDPSRVPSLLPLMVAGGLITAIAVGLQYILVFRAPAVVAGVTAVAGLAACFLTRTSLAALDESIRTSLGSLSGEAGKLYTEIET